MKINSLLFSVFLILSAAPLVARSQSNEIKLCTGQSAYFNIFKPIAEPFEKKYGIKIVIPIDISKTGAVESFKVMLTGVCETAAGTIDMEGWFKLAEKENVKFDRSKITHRTIGRDITKIIVNKATKVPKLSLEKLASIFDGTVSNWKDVGGSDTPIKIYLAKSKLATSQVFQNQVLKGKAFSKAVISTDSWDDMVEIINKTPGATGFLSSNTEHKDASVIQTEEDIGRPIVLASLGKPSENLLKLVNFITQEGKAFLPK